MEHGMVSVTLASPAKIDGKRRSAGEAVTVSATMAGELDALGVLHAGPAFGDGGAEASAADDAVKLAVAEALAAREAAVEENLSHLVAAHAAELAALKGRAEAAEAKAASLETASAGSAETMRKLEDALSQALSRAETAEAKVASLEAGAKPNTQPAKKAGGKT